ncbi:MAG TPA: beta-ketoacyl-ACP synthase III [Gemmatimonadaceae bacterium]
MKKPVAQFGGVAHSVPERVVTNHEFTSMGLETSHEWIMSRTGICSRRIASEGESTCSMAADAARGALQRSSLTADDIDVIILSTATPDRLLPSTAVDVQAAIGASRAAAFDLGAACSGWLYALTVGEGLIATGSAQNVLVVSSEKMSAIVDWSDRSTCVLFGDGAGATVLSPSSNGAGILSSYLGSDGTLADLLYRPSGGAAVPMSEAVLADHSWLVKMAGREVFKHAVLSMADAVDQALARAGLTADDIDLLIPHQANIRIIEATAKHAGLPMDKVFVNIERYGNTSSASIPISLDEAIEQGRISEGSTVLMVAFGAGLTWASMIVRF